MNKYTCVQKLKQYCIDYLIDSVINIFKVLYINEEIYNQILDGRKNKQFNKYIRMEIDILSKYKWMKIWREGAGHYDKFYQKRYRYNNGVIIKIKNEAIPEGEELSPPDWEDYSGPYGSYDQGEICEYKLESIYDENVNIKRINDSKLIDSLIDNKIFTNRFKLLRNSNRLLDSLIDSIKYRGSIDYKGYRPFNIDQS